MSRPIPTREEIAQAAAAPFTAAQETRLREIAREEAVNAVVVAAKIRGEAESRRFSLCPTWVEAGLSALDRETES